MLHEMLHEALQGFVKWQLQRPSETARHTLMSPNASVTFLDLFSSLPSDLESSSGAISQKRQRKNRIRKRKLKKEYK